MSRFYDLSIDFVDLIMKNGKVRVINNIVKPHINEGARNCMRMHAKYGVTPTKDEIDELTV